MKSNWIGHRIPNHGESNKDPMANQLKAEVSTVIYDIRRYV